MVCNKTAAALAAMLVIVGFVMPNTAFADESTASPKNSQLALASTSAASPPPSQAAPSGLLVKPHPEGASVGELSRLYEQRLIIKAQVELMNAESLLKTRGVVSAKVEESYAPSVKMVQGVGNNLFATFVYPGNMTMDARQGDTISGGYRVDSISVDQVILSKDGEKIRLGFSASPPTPLPALDSTIFAAPAMPARAAGAPGY